ncbi:TIM-barrel domain-containing protein [Alsobacter sp. KACC 23698]|uniref:TIM-barrel domain-containing protein n=1 Tax=Alsobacter sp. KACC 23698 TaxID=3149229 RepID=A0AAU7J9G1_9HYPH
MKALTHGRILGRDGPWALFGLDHGVELRVAILERDIGRVLLKPAGGYRLDRGWSIAPGRLEPAYAGRLREDLTGFACPPASLVEEHGVATLSVEGGLSAVVTLEPFSIAWRRAGEDRPFLQDRRTQAYFASRQTKALSHFTARDAGHRHHGLGDKAGPLDHTGRRFKIDAVDPCGFDAELSDPLYKAIPYVLVEDGSGAHGLYYDNLAVAEVDLGATIDNYHGLFRSYAAQDGDLDVYVLAGPSAADVTRRFSWLTGGQAFPPKWSLGFGMTSMTIADAPDADARVTGFIETCRRHDIPCDSFHFGSGYTSIGTRRYAFNWNREKFPDPAGTMERLKQAGMQPVTNLKPCLLDDHPRLDEARRMGVLVTDGETGEPAEAQFWDGLGYHVDFTNPAGRDWWRTGIQTALLDYGVVSVWSDNNEYEIWDEDARCHGDGRPFPQRLARPAQPLLMTKLAFEAQAAQAPGKRPYTITRGGAAGIARYGQTWSGDNETAWKTLRFNLAQGLNMSLSGLYNIGHDVGGFHGPSPGPELFCRFVEFCSLWPRFVMNSWKDDGVVNLPWMHPQVLPQVREAIALRYRLAPYLYTCLWSAATRDEPVVRPLFLAFPEDAGAATVQDSFMLGPDLLVAPVLEEGAVAREVYFPAHPGGWHDLRDGRAYAGGEVAEVEAPLGRLPVFARAGALTPVCVAGGAMVPARDVGRELLVFGDDPRGSTAALYEDDGETAAWRDGDGLALRFTLTRDGDARRLTMTADGRGRPAFDRIAVRIMAGPADVQWSAEPTGPVRLDGA